MADRTTDPEEFFLVDAPFATIKVSNFINASQEALTDFFSYCGAITKVELSGNEATVQFRDMESAKSAVMLSGTNLGSSQLVIEPVPEVGVEEALAWSSALQASGNVPSSPPTQTSIVDAMIAAGYDLAEQTKQKALEYDQQYAVSAKVESVANQIEAEVNLLDKEYNISGAAQEGFDNLGKKIKELDEQYEVGSSLNQAVAAAVNTGELAYDVIVAKTKETADSLPQLKEQGEAYTMAAITSAAEALESLELEKKGEAVINSISDFVQTNETAQSAWSSVCGWAASAHNALVGEPVATQETGTNTA